MCNCAGVMLSNATGKSKALFSNCAGNLSEAGHRTQVDCNCNEGVTAKADTTFSNAAGNSPLFSGRKYSNVIGEIAPITSGVTLKVDTSIQPVSTTPQTSASTTETKTFGEKLTNTVSTVSGILGSVFSKPATQTTAAPLPADEKKIPTAVYVVAGGLILLVVAYFIVKASKN